MVSVEKRLFLERIIVVDSNISVLVGIDPELDFQPIVLIRNRDFNHITIMYAEMELFVTELEQYVKDGVTDYYTNSGIAIFYNGSNRVVILKEENENLEMDYDSLLMFNDMKNLLAAELKALDGEETRRIIDTVIEFSKDIAESDVIDYMERTLKLLHIQLTQCVWGAKDYRIIFDACCLFSELIDKRNFYMNVSYLKESIYRKM